MTMEKNRNQRGTISRRGLLAAAAGGSFAVVTGLSMGRASAAGVVTRGVDYSWGRPGAGTLAASGYTFACRYLSYDTTGKNLSAGEAQDLIAAGVDIVLVWETSSTEALDGYARGAQSAQDAQSMAVGCGMPADRPIYFAVDFDASPDQQPALDSYFDGVASVLGRGRTGAYGGYYPIQRLFNDGKIAYGWQTYAWSGGQWDSRAQLRQVENGITVGGADCDLDEAWATDFGQWGHGTGGGGGGVTASGPEIAVGPNADGRLELFTVRSGELLTAWQTSVSGPFSDMAGLGGAYLSTNVATANNADGRMQVFVVGGDGRVYSKWQTSVNSSFSDWFDTNGPVSRGIATGVNADGRLEVFAVDGDGALQTSFQTSVNGSLSEWYDLGGAELSGILATANNADGRMQVFAVGGDGILYTKWQTSVNGSFSDWLSLGGTQVRGIATGLNADGRIQVFGSGVDGVLHTVFQTGVNGSFGDWVDLGGEQLSARVAAGQNEDGRLEVFVLGGDGAVYTRVQTSLNGPLSDWVDLGATQLRSMALGMNGDGRMQLFCVGGNGTVYTCAQDTPNGAWGSWPSLG